jgi:hypothetical protein
VQAHVRHPAHVRKPRALQMIRKTQWAVALAILVTTAPARADDRLITMAELNGDCRAGGTAYIYCMGYIEGVAYTMFWNGNFPEIASQKWVGDMGAACQKPAPVAALLIRAFEDFADSHPESRNDFAVNGVMAAIRSKWPCSPR